MAERELQDARIKLTIDDDDLRRTMRKIESENQKSEGRRRSSSRNTDSLGATRSGALSSGGMRALSQVVPGLGPVVRASATAASVASVTIGAAGKLGAAGPMVAGAKPSGGGGAAGVGTGLALAGLGKAVGVAALVAAAVRMNRLAFASNRGPIGFGSATEASRIIPGIAEAARITALGIGDLGGSILDAGDELTDIAGAMRATGQGKIAAKTAQDLLRRLQGASVAEKNRQTVVDLEQTRFTDQGFTDLIEAGIPLSQGVVEAIGDASPTWLQQAGIWMFRQAVDIYEMTGGPAVGYK